MQRAHVLALLVLALFLGVMILVFRIPGRADIPLQSAQFNPIEAVRDLPPDTHPARNPDLPAQNLRARAFAILSNPDDIDRMLEFCRLINGLTVAQCEEVKEALRLQIKHEGRTRGPELYLLNAYIDAAASGAGDHSRQPALSAAASQAPAAAIREILGLRNELEKMLLLCEFLPRVDASNWKAICDAAWDARAGQGENFLSNHQIRYLLEQVGRVVGRDAIESLLSDKIPQVGNTLVGWASVQPVAAMDWWYGRDRDEQRKYLNALITGVANSDPMRAATLLSQNMRPEDRSFVAATLIYSTLEVWGFQAAEGVFLQWKRTLSEDTADTDLAFSNLAQARATMCVGADPQEAKRLLDWLQPHLPSGMRGANHLIGKAGELDPELTLSWAASHAHMMDDQLSRQIHATLAQSWKRTAPESFAAWMAEHANEPAAVQMRENEDAPHALQIQKSR